MAVRRGAGTLGEDLIKGSSERDLLTGLDGSDTIIGDGAFDTIFGGDGNDIIFGDHVPAKYYLHEAGQVFRLYQGAFNRLPDGQGFQRWLTDLIFDVETVSSVASIFEASIEFKNTYGTLSDRGFISLLYENVLERSASQTELSNWEARANGTFSRSDIFVGFVESPEFISKTASASKVFSIETNEAYWQGSIYRLYEATLGREPELLGFQNWINFVSNEGSLSEAAKGFVQSKEFQNVYGFLDNGDFVDLLYNNVLGRNSDLNGRANWVERLDSGLSRAEVALGFSESREFTLAQRPNLKEWMLNFGKDEIIEAGSGTNTISGGPFSDRFIFNSGNQSSNVITDFEPWDVLDFRSFGFRNRSEVLEKFSQVASDTEFKHEETIVNLLNFDLDLLTSDNLLY